MIPMTERRQQHPIAQKNTMLQIFMNFPDLSKIPGTIASASGDKLISMFLSPEQIFPVSLNLKIVPDIIHARPPKHWEHPTQPAANVVICA